jgi:D-beta-D-heptose 7-phosphate kinase/D-beta-D-heptose 1-phosphate adenosyltransferase
MVKLSRSFSSIQPFKALVIGDFLLDTYTTGRVKRISPEAPVPVMEVLKQESRPGGAGNVVLNLAMLGAEVFAVGRLGADSSGEELKRQLKNADTSGLLIEPNYKTPVKNRLISDSQQLFRFDLETISPLLAECEQEVAVFLEKTVPLVQVIAVSDYGKGFLTRSLLRQIIALANEKKVPIIIDPKGIDFSKYSGATMIKPNLSEAYAAAKLPMSASLDEVAHAIFLATEVDLLLVTRSEAGISMFEKNGKRSDFPVRSREVKDVTGAGDTVLATLCLSVASGLEMSIAAQLANIAAGISIERLGCVQVGLPEIARRLLEQDAATKIYDENQTYVLRQVLKNRRYSLLVLGQGQRMNNVLFKTIRELSRRENSELVVYVQASPGDEFIDLLSSLSEVDFIVLQKESLEHLLEIMQPEEIFFLENNEKEILSSLLSRFTNNAAAQAKISLIKND